MGSTRDGCGPRSVRTIDALIAEYDPYALRRTQEKARGRADVQEHHRRTHRRVRPVRAAPHPSRRLAVAPSCESHHHQLDPKTAPLVAEAYKAILAGTKLKDIADLQRCWRVRA